MKTQKTLLAKAKKLAGEVSDATVGAVKAVVHAAQATMKPKPKARKRPATAKAKAVRSKAKRKPGVRRS